MSISTPYNDFQAPNNVLAVDGGPWRTPGSTSDLLCWTGTTKRGFCGPIGCLHCSFINASIVLSFNLKYIANISLPLSQYGNPDSVDYTWEYNLNWASDKTAAGAPLSTRVSVGDSSSVDNFGASDHAWLWYSDPPSLGTPFTHSGTTSLLKSADGTTGYITIIVDFSFTRQQGGDCTWYFIGGNFHITPKSTSIPASVGGSSSSSSSSVAGSVTQTTQESSHSLSSVILPGFSTQSISSSGSSDGSVGVVSNSSPNVSGVSVQTVPTAAIIGGVLGGLSALGFFALFLLLLYRKKMKQVHERDRHELAKKAGLADEDGGDDDSTRRPGTTTIHSASFVSFGFLSNDSKSPNKHERLSSVATVTAPLALTPQSNQDNHLYENHQPHPHSQQGRERRGEGTTTARLDRLHRPQQLSISHAGTVYNMDAPPPAYSDVSGIPGAVNGHRRYENEDNRDDLASSSGAHQRRNGGWSRGRVDNDGGLRSSFLSASTITPTATATPFTPGFTPR